MYPTTYGRSRLVFCNDLSERAFERLVKVLADMAGGPGRRAQRLMEEALRRKCVRLKSVFPGRTLPDLPEGCSRLSAARERLCRVTTCWIDGIKSLADDNELDVLFPDGNGRVRPVWEIITEAILDDAVLVGRLVALREPHGDSERSRRVEIRRL
ncbi:MAG: hypothetical protein SVV80_11250 [Planctomycetota bacterium]|nr:hypothetical protein [Planctomycetota bacterium]